MEAHGRKSIGLERIVSGGQTGVDRAALDAAAAHGVPTGGWCPQGRRAEDGVIDARYPLRETPSGDYAQRTRWNVRDSDATLVLTFGAPEGGTALTLEEAARQGRPCLHVQLSDAAEEEVLRWLGRHEVRVLNVAGPRQIEAPGAYEATRRFLERLFEHLQIGGTASY